MPIQSEEELRELISAVERETSELAYTLAMLRQNRHSYRTVKTALEADINNMVTSPPFIGAAQREWLSAAVESAYNVPIRWTKKGKEKEAISIAMQVRAGVGLRIAEIYGIDRHSEDMHDLNRMLQDKHGKQ